MFVFNFHLCPLLWILVKVPLWLKPELLSEFPCRGIVDLIHFSLLDGGKGWGGGLSGYYAEGLNVHDSW